MFSTREESRDQGSPITLYHFKLLTRDFRYTDAEQPVTVGGNVYQAAPFMRDNIVAAQNFDRSKLSLRTVRNAEIAQLFIAYPPSEVVFVDIYEGHDGESEFKIRWSGRVLGCSWQGNEATLDCESSTTSMRRPALRRNYQFGCPHALYGAACGASKAAATVSATVASLSGATINLPGGWVGARDPAAFRGGVAAWTAAGVSELRTIREAGSMTLVLTGSLRGIAAGTVLAVSLGCQRTMGDCEVLHNNIANFGGQPFIPVKNPFGFDSQFY